MKIILAKVEQIISAYCRPIYLSVTDEEDYILVVLAHSRYKNMSIAHRIKSVYDILEEHIPEVLSEYTVIIQAFANNELNEIIEDMFPIKND